MAITAGILSEDQILKAIEWYKDRVELIEQRITKASFSFPPTNEDKNDPSVWKGEHWKWFFTV